MPRERDEELSRWCVAFEIDPAAIPDDQRRAYVLACTGQPIDARRRLFVALVDAVFPSDPAAPFTPARYCDAWRNRAGLPRATGPATCPDCPHAGAGCPFAGCESGAVRADAIYGGPGGRPAVSRDTLQRICTFARAQEDLAPADDGESCLDCLAFLPCDRMQRIAAKQGRLPDDELHHVKELLAVLEPHDGDAWVSPYLQRARERCDTARAEAGLPPAPHDGYPCSDCPASPVCELG